MPRTNNPGNAVKSSIPIRLLRFFLRTYFKLLYHQFSWTYDLVAWLVSSGNWQQWVQSVIPYIKDTPILEIGFGPGHLLVSLHQKNITVYGLDESQQMVHIAQRRLKDHGFSPYLVCGDAQTLPFTNESFHHVVMTFPAEFILNPATIREIRRILIQGGSALVVPVAWITGRKPWERLLAWVNRITGEAPDWDPKALEPLIELGFDVSAEMIDYSQSRVLLIRLIKA
jgi:ubiquinone/menaquinone biosynthesis C-methylase UbiE